MSQACDMDGLNLVLQSIIKKRHYYRQEVVEADFAVAGLWDEDSWLGSIMKMVCCHVSVWLQRAILRNLLKGNTQRKASSI
jgi:hypothetical protein